MSYLNLKKRIPEPEEEMEGEEEVMSFSSGQSGSSYKLTCIDIFKNAKLNSGKILDIGCGFGGLIKNIHQQKPSFSFVGIDLSKAMLSMARKFCKGIDVKFYQKEADKTGFKSESFDLIVCKDTIHHFKNPVTILKEMYRLLRKGGYIHMVDIKRNTDEDIIHRLCQHIANTNVLHAIQYLDSAQAAYTIQEMKQLFKKAGIMNFKIYEPKFNNNTIKKYQILPEKIGSAELFFKTRWIAVIKK
ncbi:class I SAM-dependent methyltransferase [Candidatus Woesearchaeota archaeon]|nr:class I SAM-dependent methyltransferase [Candidatus Woesearchaeota archaeon]